MKTIQVGTVEVGTVSTREDAARLVQAIEAAELLERGAHLEHLGDERNGRLQLGAIARKELRERVQGGRFQLRREVVR